MIPEVIIRKATTPAVRDKIPFLLQDAKKWMGEKYPDIDFEIVGYIFSPSFSRSRYFRNENNEKYPKPTACISTSGTLCLYDKKSLGIKRTILFVGCEIQIMCALIHELTHHVQYETKTRIGNELDTTKNELLFLSENYSKIYNKLIN